MRTTLPIDDEVCKAVLQIAFESRRSLDEVFNELLIRGLGPVTLQHGHRRLGQLRGTITIADDFDDEVCDVPGSIDDLN